jgi:hypothetical protein
MVMPKFFTLAAKKTADIRICILHSFNWSLSPLGETWNSSRLTRKSNVRDKLGHFKLGHFNWEPCNLGYYFLIVYNY